MNKKIILLAIICFFSHLCVFAQTDDVKTIQPSVKLDWPLFDLPYQIDAMNTVGHGFFSGYANPSMAQSLALTQNIFSGFYYGMKYFHDNSGLNEILKKIIYYGGVALGSYLFMYMPGGDGWLHEEYHRAVMTRFRVNSFNGMNLFPIGATAVYVNSVKDEDVIRMKKESPPDFVRMFAAGIEGQYLLVDRLQRNNFFYNHKLFYEVTYWSITLNSHLYVMMSSQSESIDITGENESPDSRDFAGLDFTAWVYDLFRPNEPYEDRGEHPSGDGVDRYITTISLTDAEVNYLQLQGYLQLLNYLSPMMFGIRSLPMGEFEGNFALRHYLTSFGMDISAHVFLKKAPFNMIFVLHNYANYHNWFPAIETELVDYPVNIGKLNMFLSPRVLIGMQPKGQEFMTSSPAFLGLFGMRADFMTHKNIFPYIDFTAKTKGWVAGNEFLDGNVSVKVGLSLRF
jgi:hypothetical protein